MADKRISQKQKWRTLNKWVDDKLPVRTSTHNEQRENCANNPRIVQINSLSPPHDGNDNVKKKKRKKNI